MNARVDPKAEEAQPAATPEAVDNKTAPGTGAVDDAAPKKKRGSRRLLLMISVPLLLVVGGGYFYLTGGRYEDTDDAYVKQAIVSLSPDIAGRVVAVDVKENQKVQKGEELFRLDPKPYQITLAKAEAALASARLNVEQLRVSYKTAVAKLAAARDVLAVRERDQTRVSSLTDKGLSTEATSDATRLALQQAQSNVTLAQQGVNAALAALGGNPDIETDQHPTVQSALAAVDSAKRDLDKTVVAAPGAGIISNVSDLNVGQYVSAGTTIANLVETNTSWVEANFKETQLGAIKPGQAVEVSVDTYPGHPIKGEVGSIGAATGEEFSLIPAQNATGNWVKVVQRVPVRIVLKGKDLPDLRSGMSVTVSVDTGATRLDKLTK